MPSAPILDGTATGVKSTSGSCTATLTTSNGNDVICVLAYVEVTSGNAPAISSVSGTGLTFTKRKSVGGSGSSAPLNSYELWYAEATSALTSEVITVSWASTYDDAAILCFGVNGCYLASPWDSSTTVPAVLAHVPSAAWTPSFTNISTNNPDDFLIFACGNASAWTSIGTLPSGYSEIGYVSNSGGTNFAQVGAAYERITTALSSATITWGSSQGNYQSGAAIFDALTANSPPIFPGSGAPINIFLRRQLQLQTTPPPPRRSKFTVGVPPAVNQADYAQTSDSIAYTFAAPKTVSDTVASSDSYSILNAFSQTVADTVASSDALSYANAGTTRLKFDGLVLKSLTLWIPDEPNFGPIPVFPSLPEGFPAKVSPVLDTIVGTTKSLREMRVAQQTYPIWDIEILFEELKDETQNQSVYGPFYGNTQYQQLVQLWLSMYGQANVFAFDCPWDDSRSNQAIGTGDGITFIFPAFVSWGTYGSGLTNLIPVGQINQIESVYVDDVLVSATHYNIQRNKIVFTDALGNTYPPASGATITMTFSFYYLCRWTEDEQDYEEFAKNRWTVTSLKFRASPWI